MCGNVSNVDSLMHSSDAISVTARFYNKEVVVYVEGPDDVPFWDALFCRVVNRDFYEITPVNGKEQLIPYIEGIENGTIKNAFAATDLDYNLFTDKGRSPCSYVIYTYGHSIENTMFCPHNVSIYLRRAMKKTNHYVSDVSKWYEDLFAATRPLLAMDVLNSIDVDCKFHKSNGDNLLLGRGYYYYQNLKQTKDLDTEKINKEVAAHPDFDLSMLTRIEGEIERFCQSREPRYLVQGHFLADAVMNYVRVFLHENRIKHSISKDAFYLTFCDCIERCDPLCHDKQHVLDYIEKAVKDYRLNKVTA